MTDDERNDSRAAQLAENVLEALRGLRFGSVEIVVHEARVVQIVRTERVRFADEGGNARR
jgi:hypothetical protein